MSQSTSLALRILIVGSGGREHAYAWKLSQSSSVEAVFVAPGNGGSASPLGTGEGTTSKITNANVKADDYTGLVKFGQENGVNLVVPGPEAPLVDGIEGYFRAGEFNLSFPKTPSWEVQAAARTDESINELVGIKTFGPSKETAQLEASKAFSKDFMKRHNIPTAAYETFRDYDQARAYVDSVPHNVVIKASGLAGGKGVIIPTDKAQAHEALRQVMVDHSFGDAGDEVVVEEFLDGDELSILTFSDGYTIRSLPPAQDHKRVLDGDAGPNTGGMGSYAPTRIANEHTRQEIDRSIVQLTIDGLRKEGQYLSLLKRVLEEKAKERLLTLLHRTPIRWYPLHGSNEDIHGLQSAGVQCPRRRPRNGNASPPVNPGHRPCSCHARLRGALA